MAYNDHIASFYEYPVSLSNRFMEFARLFIEQVTKGVKRETLPYIHTYYGIKFRHTSPTPEDICIEDIAHALSRICRFTGHVAVPLYSVAEHSVRVSYACDPQDALWGLLHDASEAYCMDLSRPLKRAPGMESYRFYESQVSAAVREKFNLPGSEPPSVLRADLRYLATEKRDLFIRDCTWAVNKGEEGEPYSEHIVAWDQAEAERRFLMRFYELTGVNKFYEKYKDEQRLTNFQLLQ